MNTNLEDTTLFLLSYHMNYDLDDMHLAIKLGKVCKKIRDRTKDAEMIEACRTVLLYIKMGEYARVVLAASVANSNHRSQYESC